MEDDRDIIDEDIEVGNTATERDRTEKRAEDGILFDENLTGMSALAQEDLSDFEVIRLGKYLRKGDEENEEKEEEKEGGKERNGGRREEHTSAQRMSTTLRARTSGHKRSWVRSPHWWLSVLKVGLQ